MIFLCHCHNYKHADSAPQGQAPSTVRIYLPYLAPTNSAVGDDAHIVPPSPTPTDSHPMCFDEAATRFSFLFVKTLIISNFRYFPLR